MSGLILRHAPTFWSAAGRWQGPETDIPLSEAGRIASSRLREILPPFARRRDTTVLSSPLRRCIETARLVSGHHDVFVVPALREISVPELVGLTREEIGEIDPDFERAWFEGRLPAPPPGVGVEDIDAFAARVTAIGETLERRTDDWLAVTHAGVVHALAARAGLPPRPAPNLAGLVFDDDGWARWASDPVPSDLLRIGVGADHYGIGLLGVTIGWLEDHGYEVIDYTPNRESDDEIDYPGVALEVAADVQVGNLDRGVLICGTGIGMSISANAVADVRAACVADPYSAERAQASNDAQILTFGEEVVGPAIVPLLLEAWLSAHLDSDRSLRKVSAILQYESSVRPPHREA